MRNGGISEDDYWASRDTLTKKVNAFKKELYDDGNLNKRHMLELDFLSAASAGIIGLLKSRKSSLAYASAAFAAAHLAQRWIGKNEVIERWRIKPEEAVFGKYIAASQPRY